MPHLTATVGGKIGSATMQPMAVITPPAIPVEQSDGCARWGQVATRRESNWTDQTEKNCVQGTRLALLTL